MTYQISMRCRARRRILFSAGGNALCWERRRLISSSRSRMRFSTPSLGGLVVDAVAQIVGQALHVSHFVFEIVRVLVALAVAEVLHQSRGRIAQMQRDGFGGGALHIVPELSP